jgi:hypothetical protein
MTIFFPTGHGMVSLYHLKFVAPGPTFLIFRGPDLVVVEEEGGMISSYGRRR